MADLLVKLYDWQRTERPEPAGIAIRRAFAAEKRLVAQWVAQHFGERWASECEISFARQLQPNVALHGGGVLEIRDNFSSKVERVVPNALVI